MSTPGCRRGVGSRPAPGAGTPAPKNGWSTAQGTVSLGYAAVMRPKQNCKVNTIRAQLRHCDILKMLKAPIAVPPMRNKMLEMRVDRLEECIEINTAPPIRPRTKLIQSNFIARSTLGLV